MIIGSQWRIAQIGRQFYLFLKTEKCFLHHSQSQLILVQYMDWYNTWIESTDRILYDVVPLCLPIIKLYHRVPLCPYQTKIMNDDIEEDVLKGHFSSWYYSARKLQLIIHKRIQWNCQIIYTNNLFFFCWLVFWLFILSKKMFDI